MAPAAGVCNPVLLKMAAVLQAGDQILGVSVQDAEPLSLVGLALVRGRSAVDYEARTGHKAGIVGGEKDDAFGNVVRHAEPADRMP